MRVILAGGTGFIGRRLAGDLAGAGHEVVVLSRDPWRATSLPQGVRAERWDGKTAQGWGRLADGAGAIVNLAGENLAGSGFFPTRWSDERKQVLRQSRLDAGRAVVEAVTAAVHKPQVVVQMSGIGHYGDRQEVVTEKDAPGSDFLARLTLEWEASTVPVTAQGVRQVVARTGVVLSPGEGALYRLMLPFKLFAGGPMGSGRQGFSWIHPADNVAALRFLVEHREAGGPFNVVAPGNLTNAEFGRALAHVMRRPFWLPVPGFALRLALGEVATTVLEGQRALPRRLQELGFTFRFPTAEVALRDLLR